jgi:hypothetical protein
MTFTTRVSSVGSIEQEDSRSPAHLAADREESRERGLDATLAETFPCSDPLSSIPNPVSRPGPGYGPGAS